jgi:hypothetical protein
MFNGDILAFKRNSNTLTVAALITLLILVIALFSILWPRNEMRFFELGLLDKNKNAEAYFALANSTLEIGSQVNWFVFVHNHMGDAEKVSVRIKLLNSTMAQPINSKNMPSPFNFFEELYSSLSNDESVLLPFSWGISNAVSANGETTVRQLIVNNRILDIDVSSNGHFIIVFELWVYSQTAQNYLFGWRFGNSLSSASVTMGFNIE